MTAMLAPEDQFRLKALVRRHEGVRRLPYEDSVGKLTIGVGRNLTDRGLSDAEVEFLFTNDLAFAASDLATQDWARGHSAVRSAVLIDMCFNLGLPRLLQFARMISALRARDYERAAMEMLDSKWAHQVGSRAQRLASMMRSDEWPTS